MPALGKLYAFVERREDGHERLMLLHGKLMVTADQKALKKMLEDVKKHAHAWRRYGLKLQLVEFVSNDLLWVDVPGVI